MSDLDTRLEYVQPRIRILFMCTVYPCTQVLRSIGLRLGQDDKNLKP